MEEAFRRAQLYIDAIRGCSIHASIATVKSYATQLDKELAIIKKDILDKLAYLDKELAALDKPKEPRIPVGSFGKEKRKSWWQKPKMSLPPPEVASTIQGEQAEKK